MITITLCIEMRQRVCEEKNWVGSAPPNALRRNRPECAAGFDYIQRIKSGLTKGLIQVGNLDERGPLPNNQKIIWEMMVNRMWIAILKP